MSEDLRSSDQFEFHRVCTKAALPPLRSDFLVRRVTDDAVWLVDNQGIHKRVSVTNDAEAVVAHVDRHFPGRRIFYRDTMGNWDELVHDRAKFIGFEPARHLEHPQ